MERNRKINPPFNYLIIYIIVGFFLMLGMYEIMIRLLDISFRYGHFSTNFSPLSLPFDAESCHYGQTNSGLMTSPVSGETQTKPTRRPITVSPCKIHQVFLNFRGEQLRYNFVSHITKALQRNKIRFFIDKDEQRGKDLNNLFVRIEESRIALAVISSRYSESRWCMNELVKIKKLVDQGKLVVIPIFYNVEAKDVRKPTWDSEFGRNFLRLAETSKPDEIKEWKEALESTCNKMGLSLGEKSSESDCIEEIVMALQRVIETMELDDEEK